MTASKKARLVIGGIFILLAILFAVRFVKMRGMKPAKSIDEIQAENGIPVDVVIARKGKIDKYMRLLGSVQGYEQVSLTSSLPIDVTGIVKHEGDKVRKGDVIIRLARDRRGNAYHQYSLAKQALENAERDLQRTRNLYREGAVSEQMLEKARLAYRNAKAQYTQALSMVDLVTPINGVVTRIDAVVGTAAVPGVPLATVASTDSVRIRCFVGQDEVRSLEPGQKAFICLSTPDGDPADDPLCDTEGVVKTVSLSADQETKLFLAEIVAGNPAGKMKPGLVASVSVLVDRIEDVVTIPKDAVVRREKGDFVYLVKAGKAALTKAELGVAGGEQIAVRAGIEEGDTLVVRGQFKLSDGLKVLIHKVEE
jgi:RND family efflux transporter MFP subunit